MSHHNFEEFIYVGPNLIYFNIIVRALQNLKFVNIGSWLLKGLFETNYTLTSIL